MYKAVISDLDGTLLNNQHQISEFTKNTLKTLVDQGIKFVVATGRHIVDVQGIRQTMGFECDLITSNGALVSAADDSLLFEHTIPPTVAGELIRMTNGNPAFDANIYKRHHWYLPREIPELLEFHQDSGFLYTVADLNELPLDGIHKFCFTGEHPALVDLEHELLVRYADQATVVFSRDDCLEVMAANVNKGNSAREALAGFGISLEEAIAFGDGMNDYEMLTMAAQGFVMSNATPRLMHALPDHPRARHCDDDGVATQLAEIFQL